MASSRAKTQRLGVQTRPFSHQWLLFEPHDKTKRAEQEAHCASGDQLRVVMWFFTVQRCRQCVLGEGERGVTQSLGSFSVTCTSLSMVLPQEVCRHIRRRVGCCFIRLFAAAVFLLRALREGRSLVPVLPATGLWLLLLSALTVSLPRPQRSLFLVLFFSIAISGHLDVRQSPWGKMPRGLLAVGLAPSCVAGLKGAS